MEQSRELFHDIARTWMINDRLEIQRLGGSMVLPRIVHGDRQIFSLTFILTRCFYICAAAVAWIETRPNTTARQKRIETRILRQWPLSVSLVVVNVDARCELCFTFVETSNRGRVAALLAHGKREKTIELFREVEENLTPDSSLVPDFTRKEGTRPAIFDFLSIFSHFKRGRALRMKEF